MKFTMAASCDHLAFYTGTLPSRAMAAAVGVAAAAAAIAICVHDSSSPVLMLMTQPPRRLANDYDTKFQTEYRK